MDNLIPLSIGMNMVQHIIVLMLPMVLAITVHEAAHGWVALKFGDKTAAQEGRLTLNPLKHIDLVGTIILPTLFSILFTGLIFGWAKPVPIDARNFKNPKRAMMIVALAGPMSNLLMAIGWALLGWVGVQLYRMEFISVPFILWSRAGITINLALALINMLPVPPLDGSRVLSGLLPNYWAWQFNRFERYGLFFLLALFASEATGYTSILSYIFDYPKYIAENLLFSLAGR
jgi:Zn-dependent protease